MHKVMKPRQNSDILGLRSHKNEPKQSHKEVKMHARGDSTSHGQSNIRPKNSQKHAQTKPQEDRNTCLFGRPITHANKRR